MFISLRAETSLQWSSLINKHKEKLPQAQQENVEQDVQEIYGEE